MAGFVGQFPFQMDEKGRVSLPAEFRRKTDNPRFVLIQWEPTHLTLFPESAWEEVQERLLEKRRATRDAAHVLRALTSRAAEVEPDKQGRILIPGHLRDRAKLEGTALLVGALDRIEIWNPEAFADLYPDDPGSDEAKAEITHEIFG